MKLPIGKVLLYCRTGKGEPSDCVKWAGVALCEEFDTPSLRILAGLSEPFNFFEIKEYTEAALYELNIEIPSEEQAVSTYAKDLSRDIINNPETIRHNLKKLFELCISHNYQNDIYDFYLLYCAWGDIHYEEVQHYWEGATKDNIDGIVVNRCREYNENK